MQRRNLIVVLITMIGSIAAFAEPSQSTMQAWEDQLVTTFSKLESPNIKVLSYEGCKSNVSQVQLGQKIKSSPDPDVADHIKKNEEKGSGFFGNLFKWTPSGLPPQRNKEGCQAEDLENEILNSSGQYDFQAQKMRGFFNRCGDHLERHWPGDLWGLLKISTVSYPLCDHPYVRKLHFNLGGGYTQRGYLALKPDPSPKPMIIIKCGAFCNTGDASTKWSMMHTFDSGPFNVLLVGNFTGQNFVADNSRIGIGGHEEGMLMIRLAEFLRNHPELGPRISSVHLMGISLGGQAALYGGYYGGYNRLLSGQTMIQSSMAICPVVDLQPSMVNLFQKNIKGRLMRYVFLSEITAAISVVPILGDIFKSLGEIADNPEIPHRVAEGTVKYYNETDQDWQLSPFQNLNVNSTEQLWRLNQFQRYARATTDIPVLAMPSKNDWIVPYDFNSRVMKSELNNRRGISTVRVLDFNTGNHCALNMGYGWDTMTAMARGFFLSNSPEIALFKETKTKPLVVDYWSRNRRLYKYEKHFSQKWKIERGKSYFNVYFKVFSPYSNDRCWRMSNPSEARRQCFRSFRAKIPVSSLPFNVRRTPRSKAEAQEMSRWANYNLKFLDSSGNRIQDGNAQPASLTWTSYRQ